MVFSAPHIASHTIALTITLLLSRQTVRRPAAYYQHLLDYERGFEVAGAHVRGAQLLLEGEEEGEGEGGGEGEREGGDMRRMLEQHRQLQTKAGEQDIPPGNNALTGTNAVSMQAKAGVEQGTGAVSSYEASQIPLLPEDSNSDSAVTGGSGVLPAGVYDINNQQVDVRTRNSWYVYWFRRGKKDGREEGRGYMLIHCLIVYCLFECMKFI